MSDRLPLFCAAALAIAVAWLGTVFHIRGIAIAASIVAVLAVVGAVAAPTREQRKRGAVFTIGSACLGDNDFCRHGIVVGQPGVGKTEFAKRMLLQVTESRPNWGGIITDEKGDMHLLAKRVFAALGKSDKLIELRPRKFGEKGPPPPCRMNLIGDRSISWQSHAQLIVDTAVSQGQKTSQAHFKTQAIDRMAEAMETIALAGLQVTIPAVYEFIKFPDLFDLTLTRMMEREFDDPADRERAPILFDGWKQYLGKAPEELSGSHGLPWTLRS